MYLHFLFIRWISDFYNHNGYITNNNLVHLLHEKQSYIYCTTLIDYIFHISMYIIMYLVIQFYTKRRIFTQYFLAINEPHSGFFFY